MMTNVAATTTPATLLPAEHISALTDTQKLLIVNGSMEVMHLLESVLDAGYYDVVFAESSAHAYSQIKRVQPNLVILCVGIDDVDGFQVLSMLKLDEETRRIPVLTYTTEFDGHEPEDADEIAESAGFEMFGPKPVTVSMN
jgi:putative two-component system response regulator